MVTTMKTNRVYKILIAFGTAIGFTLPAYAENGSIEAFGGNANTTLDAKLSFPLTEKTGFFLRERVDAGYDASVGSFTLVDFVYTLPAGFTLLVEGQAYSHSGIVSRFGADYFSKAGNFKSYSAVTIKATEEPNAELTMRLTYSPKVSENLQLFSQIEAIGDMGLNGHQWSTERLRLGIERDAYRAGVGADLSQTKTLLDGYNVGVFIGKNF